jgi:Cu-Zn family superoxide dismutase
MNGVRGTPVPTSELAFVFGLRRFQLDQTLAGCIWTCLQLRNRDVHMNSFRASFIGVTVLLLAGSIALAQTPAAKSASSKGIAVLHPTAGNKVSGTVTFTPVADGVQVHAEITGLTPGKHGFHVHEFGDCSAADASSAGGHFNPTHEPHAGPDAAQRHVGDMGNIEADASGRASLNYVDHHMSLSNDQTSVIGRAVIVHAKPDDLKSQPSGDAGARVACGVIGWAKS